MTAPTNNPVVSSIGLSGPTYLLGEVTNQYQPVKLSTWNVVIPSSLLGNEAAAGYAAFTTDNVTVTRGSTGLTLKNLVGVFENQYFNEWSVGSLTGTDTLGNYFTVSVCSIGSISVYNGTAISLSVASGLSVALVSTNSAVTVGSFYQGSPTYVTGLDVSAVFRPRTAQSTVGAGFLVDILQIA